MGDSTRQKQQTNRPGGGALGCGQTGAWLTESWASQVLLVILGRVFAGWFGLETGGDDQQIIGEHRRADQQLEALAAVQATALHTAAASQHADRSFDAGAKLLGGALEGATLFVGGALGGLTAAALGNAEELELGRSRPTRTG